MMRNYCNLWGLALGLLGASILGGCTQTQTVRSNPVTESHQVAASQPVVLALQYADQGARDAVAQLGLTPMLEAYWQAYAQRDWVGRYKMEKFRGEIEEDFYRSYHQPAWTLLSLEVTSVDASKSPERVRLVLSGRFRNPDRQGQERASTLLDLWTLDGGRWMHVNSDPMLNGLKAVE